MYNVYTERKSRNCIVSIKVNTPILAWNDIIQLIGSEYAYVFTNDIIIESPISGVNLT